MLSHLGIAYNRTLYREYIVILV